MDQVSESRQLNEALGRWSGSPCADCGARLCGHGVLCAVALGLKDRPRCLSCAAFGLGRDLAEMRRHLSRWLGGRDCYKKAWAKVDPVACETPCPLVGLFAGCPDPDDSPENDSPEKGTPDRDSPDFVGSLSLSVDQNEPGGQPGPISEVPAIVHDFGDLGCGDLVLQLRRILRELPPGTVLRILATDPGAPQDIPAWVRMTGHTLLGASHPVYDLRKRTDS